MRQVPVVVLLAVLAVVLTVVLLPASATQEVDPEVLGFETGRLDGRPGTWTGGPRGTIFIDSAVMRSGRYAGRVERTATSDGAFSSLTLMLPRTRAGATLELRGWLRTRDVDGWAGLWLRQDAAGERVQFDNMHQRNLRGTTGWTEYRITLPLDGRTDRIALGVLLAGTGTVWADDLELLIDGRPVAEAPAHAAPSTDASLDREFAAGSRIATRPLSAAQVGNLALLGRVWGFIKYHHPSVTGGEVDWDAELFRAMPGVLDARDRAAAAAHISTWLAELGEPAPCGQCATLPDDLHLPPDNGWIEDAGALGSALSGRLVAIHHSRPAGGAQRYLSQVPGVRNPNFVEHEARYADLRAPDAGYRLLGLFRFWNIIHYWFPYRDLIGEDWDAVLTEFVPRLMAADDSIAYRLEMMRLVARVNDGHANLGGAWALRPPRGPSQLPVRLRFVEGKPVVVGFLHPELGPASGLRVGDVVERIGGVAVDSLVSASRPYYGASNETHRLHMITAALTRGEPGAVPVEGTRAGRRFRATPERVAQARLGQQGSITHDLPGETFRMLADDVAYLKLSSIVAADVEGYIRRAAGARVLVIDIRNYPSEFVPFVLGGHLVTAPTPFARFTYGDMANPGAFRWTPPLSIAPRQPHFAGRVVVLVDESSISQSEYTAMAFRAAPNAIVVGSTTAGADGNVSRIPLPGGLDAMISGIGVHYPDRAPTQRIGIVPDLEVRPTIAGIRAGRDEVLEAGVSRALGRPFRLAER